MQSEAGLAGPACPTPESSAIVLLPRLSGNPFSVIGERNGIDFVLMPYQRLG
jgi:hypothetical protein